MAKIRRQDTQFVFISIVVLAILAILLQIPWSPANHKISVDGSVFAYGGVRILNGDLPYRDFWDHKPPAVFYLNALAFRLWGGDAWGVWYLAVVWTFAIAVCFYSFLKQLVPRLLALMGSIILVATFIQSDFYEGTNLTEFYGLLPSILALYFTYIYLTHYNRVALVGLGGALITGFMFKQTDIATAVTCVIMVFYLTIRQMGLKKAIAALLWSSILPVLVLTVVVVYWGFQGALSDLWQATIGYNFYYVQSYFGIRALYDSIRTLATIQSLQPLFIMALGTGFALWMSRRSWKNLPRAADRRTGLVALAVDWTYAICVIALAAEIFLLSIEGRGFGHYYITLLPALCAAASYWFRFFSPAHIGTSVKENLAVVIRPLVMAIIFVWLFVVIGLVRPSITEMRQFITDAPDRRPLRTNVGKYILANTIQTDTVLYWNVGAEVNFETGRKAPSRYFYTLPLFQPGYQNAKRWAEFINDIKTNRPPLLITLNNTGYAPMLDVPEEDLASACDCSGEILSGLAEFSAYVSTNYDRELILQDTFVAYHLKIP